MTEHEILMLNSTQYINNAMYQIAIAIFVFISFRAARISNENGASMIMKILVTVFGLFVCFWNLTMAGWRGVFDQMAASNLASLQDSGTKLSASSVEWVEASGVKASDAATLNLFGDIPSVIFTLVILAIILLVTWGPKMGSATE